MATQKWCNVAGCKNFIFATLNDLAEHGWSAFQIPAGNRNGKVLCFCPEHQEEMKEEMEKRLIKQSEEKKK